MNILDLSEVVIDAMDEALKAECNLSDFGVFISNDEYVSSVRKVELRRISKTGNFVLVFYDK